MNHLVKTELGFQGFILSDWGAQHTGIYSALAGLDMTMPGESFNKWLSGKSSWGPLLTKAVYNGTVPQDKLNDMVLRILAPFFATGAPLPTLEDKPNFSSWTPNTYGQQFPFQKYGSIVQQNLHIDARSKFSYSTALSVAREAIVLLKNDGHNLPIARVDNVRRILVAGLGSGPNTKGWNTKDKHRFNGVLTSGWGSASVNNPFVITPYEAISKRAREQGMLVNFYNENWNLDDIHGLADFADMAIVVVNSASGEGYSVVDQNFGDRRNLSLWHNGDELILKVASKCRKTVVVVNAVGPVDMKEWIHHENVVAVLYAPPLGQFVGQAIAEVLFGEVNPSGKLPFTISKKKNHYVPIISKLINWDPSPQDDFDRGVYLDYRYFEEHNIPTVFEFGFGLSYTTFDVWNLKIVEVTEPTRYLNCPAEYLPPIEICPQETCNPDDALFPHEETSPVPGFIYSFLYSSNVRDLKETEKFDYPKGYNPDQPTCPPLAGGGVGGNPSLWDVLYEVTAEVKNSGHMKGGYVAQLYIQFPNTLVDSPPKVLRGFDKVFLKPKQVKTVKFEITRRDLSIWEPISQQWIIQTGTYKVFVSSSCKKVEVSGEIDMGC
jgi:beta-glucosidase